MQVQIGLEKESSFQLAYSIIKRGQHMEGLDRFIKILEKNPRLLSNILIPLYKHLKHNEDDNQLRIIIAQLYIFCERYKEAIYELEQLAEEHPHFTQTYFLLSKIYKKNIEQQTIFTIFERAFNQGIYDSAITDLLPKVYMDNKDVEKSIHFFETLLKKTPQNLHYHKTLASLYKQTRQYDRAIEVLEQMVFRSPDLAPEAAKQAESMCRTDPMNPKIRETLIKFYLQSCQPEPAVRHIQDMITMDPSYRPQAIEHFKLALESYPNTKIIILALSKTLVETNAHTEALHYLEALEQNSSEDPTPILEIIQTILEQIPGQALALELYINILIKQEKYAEAIPYLKTLSELPTPPTLFIETRGDILQAKVPKSSDEITLILARTFANSDNQEKCLEMCEKLLNTPYHCDARLLEVDIFEKENKYEEGLNLLHMLIKQFPENSDVHKKTKTLLKQKLEAHIHEHDIKKLDNYFYIGQWHLQNGNIYEALENFQKITPEDDDYQTCQVLIARCFLELGRYDMTINQLTRTIQYLDNKDDELTNHLRFLLCINHIYLGQVKEAIQELETILEYDINFKHVDPLLKTLKEQSLLDLRGKTISGCLTSGGMTLINLPNMEEEQVDPQKQRISFAHPHNNQGVEYLLKQNPTNAEAEFNLAIQMDPQLTAAHCNLSILKLQKKDYEAAMNHLKEAEELNKKFDLIFLNKGLIYLAQEKYDLAVENFQKALKLNPNNHLAKLNLGDTYAHQNRLKLAFQYWSKASELGTLPQFIQRRVFYLYDPPPQNLDWITHHSPNIKELIPGL